MALIYMYSMFDSCRSEQMEISDVCDWGNDWGNFKALLRFAMPLLELI